MEEQYQTAMSLFNSERYQEAKTIFDELLLENWKDSSNKADLCVKEIEKIKKAEEERKQEEKKQKEKEAKERARRAAEEAKKYYDRCKEEQERKEHEEALKRLEAQEKAIKKLKAKKRAKVLVPLILLLILAGAILVFIKYWQYDENGHNRLFLSQKPHDFERMVIKESTCSEEGAYKNVCKVCGYISEEIPIPTIAHTYTNTKITKQPTCTEEGTKLLTCSVCGHDHTESIPKLAHKQENVKVIKIPTCQITGSKTYYCPDCKTAYWDTIPIIDHDCNDVSVTKEATCTGTGIKTYKCSMCGKIQKTETIPANGHSWDTATIVSKPTCTARGQSVTKCTVCGEEKTEIIDALGHDFSITKKTDSTCAKEGSIVYTCKRCSEKKTETIPKKEHNYTVSKEVKPTCDNDGYIQYKCSGCKNTYTETREALGHTMQNGYCTVCNLDYNSFKVGSKGPAGGTIVYDCDADNYSGNADGLVSSVCGWRFLELGPKDIKEGLMLYVFPFGYCTHRAGYNLYVNGTEKYDEGTADPYDGKCTGWDIGTGAANTRKLINNIIRYTTNAATKCDEYTLNGYSDWFLPSIEELKVASLVVDFTGTYWSSSESSTDKAYCISDKKAIMRIERNTDNFVRPMRSF